MANVDAPNIPQLINLGHLICLCANYHENKLNHIRKDCNVGYHQKRLMMNTLKSASISFSKLLVILRSAKIFQKPAINFKPDTNYYINESSILFRKLCNEISIKIPRTIFTFPILMVQQKRQETFLSSIRTQIQSHLLTSVTQRAFSRDRYYSCLKKNFRIRGIVSPKKNKSVYARADIFWPSDLPTPSKDQMNDLLSMLHKYLVNKESNYIAKSESLALSFATIGRFGQIIRELQALSKELNCFYLKRNGNSIDLVFSEAYKPFNEFTISFVNSRIQFRPNAAICKPKHTKLIYDYSSERQFSFTRNFSVTDITYIGNDLEQLIISILKSIHFTKLCFLWEVIINALSRFQCAFKAKFKYDPDDPVHALIVFIFHHEPFLCIRVDIKTGICYHWNRGGFQRTSNMQICLFPEIILSSVPSITWKLLFGNVISVNSVKVGSCYFHYSSSPDYTLFIDKHSEASILDVNTLEPVDVHSMEFDIISKLNRGSISHKQWAETIRSARSLIALKEVQAHFPDNYRVESKISISIPNGNLVLKINNRDAIKITFQFRGLGYIQLFLNDIPSNLVEYLRYLIKEFSCLSYIYQDMCNLIQNEKSIIFDKINKVHYHIYFHNHHIFVEMVNLFQVSTYGFRVQSPAIPKLTFRVLGVPSFESNLLLEPHYFSASLCTDIYYVILFSEAFTMENVSFSFIQTATKLVIDNTHPLIFRNINVNTSALFLKHDDLAMKLAVFSMAGPPGQQNGPFLIWKTFPLSQLQKLAAAVDASIRLMKILNAPEIKFGINQVEVINELSKIIIENGLVNFQVEQSHLMNIPFVTFTNFYQNLLILSKKMQKRLIDVLARINSSFDISKVLSSIKIRGERVELEIDGGLFILSEWNFEQLTPSEHELQYLMASFSQNDDDVFA